MMFLILTATNGDKYRLNSRYIEFYEDRVMDTGTKSHHRGTVLILRPVGTDNDGRPAADQSYLAQETPEQIDEVLNARKPVKESDYLPLPYLVD